MANGLHVVFDPISVRRNDVDAVNTANIDQILRDLQADHDIRYCIFGDGIFHALAAEETTIRSYHRALIGAPLTPYQEHENTIMRKVRVEIEHVWRHNELFRSH